TQTFLNYYTYGKIKKVDVHYDEIPFKVVLDLNHVQLINVEYKVRVIAPGRVMLSLHTEKEPMIYDFNTKEKKKIKLAMDLKKELRMGETLELPNQKLTIIQNPKFDFSAKGLPEETYGFVIADPQRTVKKYLKAVVVAATNKNASIIQLTLRTPVP